MITETTLDRVADDDDIPLVSPGKMRADAIKRLQIGLSGLIGVLLLIGLASIIKERANEADLGTVPESMPTVAPQAVTTPNKDPLADAGVQPEIPSASPSPTATPQGGANVPAPQP